MTNIQKVESLSFSHKRYRNHLRIFPTDFIPNVQGKFDRLFFFIKIFVRKSRIRQKELKPANTIDTYLNRPRYQGQGIPPPPFLGITSHTPSDRGQGQLKEPETDLQLNVTYFSSL